MRRRKPGQRAGRALCLAALMSVAFSASSVADTNDPARAEELIKTANDFRKSGHEERALPLLQQAYDLARTPRTAAQLGLVELALGYWTAANEHLSEALTFANHHPWIDKHLAALESALRTTKSHLAELTVDGKPDGAEVLVNGKTMGTLPLSGPLVLGEGQIELELRLPGHRSVNRSLTLTGGDRPRVAFELVPATAAKAVAEPVAPPRDPSMGEPPRETPAVVPTPAPAGPSHRREDRAPATNAQEAPTWRRVLAWSLLAGAGAAASIGAWQHVQSRRALGNFEDIPACGAAAPMRGSDPRCRGLYDNYFVDRTRAFVGYGVAAALGVGAVTFFILNSAGGGATDVAFAPGEVRLNYRGAF